MVGGVSQEPTSGPNLRSALFNDVRSEVPEGSSAVIMLATPEHVDAMVRALEGQGGRLVRHHLSVEEAKALAGRRRRRSGSRSAGGVTCELVLNVIWLIFGGLWLAILYSLAGILAFILIITIPFGFAAFRMARFCLWPFGRTLVKKDTSGVGSIIGNIIWVVLFGWELALAHLITGIAQCLTIIGIPLGLANFKLIPVSVWPLGRENVSVEEAHQMGYSGLGIPS